MFIRRADLSEPERQEIDELRQLLNLHPDASEFELVFGPTPASDREIAVQTRSLTQILIEVGDRSACRQLTSRRAGRPPVSAMREPALRSSNTCASTALRSGPRRRSSRSRTGTSGSGSTTGT